MEASGARATGNARQIACHHICHQSPRRRAPSRQVATAAPAAGRRCGNCPRLLRRLHVVTKIPCHYPAIQLPAKKVCAPPPLAPQPDGARRSLARRGAAKVGANFVSSAKRVYTWDKPIAAPRRCRNAAPANTHVCYLLLRRIGSPSNMCVCL